MTGWPSSPVIYEIDTWPWLRDVEASLERRVTLADVPAAVWDSAVPEGADAVWLMGVWQRSPAGLAVARQDSSLQRAFRAALPDLDDSDVVGSPYCVRRYVVDDRLGGRAGLAAARAELARRGVRLILDYVPNHVAPDHSAVREHPEWFVQGTVEERDAAPNAWLDVDGRLLAHGRDPYFAPWPDVVQLNAFEPRLREATSDVLTVIGDQCDGVRCDMAMLMTNDVFAKTWGHLAGTPPAEEFWPGVLDRVRPRAPDLVFIAEAYWDMEWTLQEQGFDFCYDKRLYDRLAHEDAGSVRMHLQAGVDYQKKLVRFIENHDEPRAAATFQPGQDRAAAVVIATVPGATLWHDGQMEGRRIHLPVFLSRRPAEPVDGDLLSFYRHLLSGVASSGMRRGQWSLLDTSGWPDNPSHEALLAWAWSQDGRPQHVVVVNFSSHWSQGCVGLPWPGLRGRVWRMADVVDGRRFDRPGDALVDQGLFVDLPPWGSHVLAVEPS
jgi:hypothetical protein